MDMHMARTRAANRPQFRAYGAPITPEQGHSSLPYFPTCGLEFLSPALLPNHVIPKQQSIVAGRNGGTGGRALGPALLSLLQMRVEMGTIPVHPPMPESVN